MCDGAYIPSSCTTARTDIASSCDASPGYDSILVIGFGGPEKPEDVMPFLENVTRGRGVPRERLLEVEEHYQHFGGVSPINQQVRELIAALGPELTRHGIDLPIYWGNRNWHPFLRETIATMAADGRRRTIGIVLSAYSSYSSCRQYREDVIRACAEVGENAPLVEKVRVFYDHPEFVAANADRVRAAIDTIPHERRGSLRLAFTAHSIPVAMASNSQYEQQLRESCRLVAAAVGIETDRWRLVYQSRSGSPSVPWLEPDILEHLATLPEEGVQDVIIHPIGFLSDHIEVLFDLDEEAHTTGTKMGLNVVRSKTVGTHPRFVAMLRELVQERLEPSRERRSAGWLGPAPDFCANDCCQPPARSRPAMAVVSGPRGG